MKMNKLFNLKDTNYKVSPGGVYIGREMKRYNLSASIWANQFKIDTFYQGRILTREYAIEAYADWLLYSDEGLKVFSHISELTCKNLFCWCDPRRCHGEILIRLSNPTIDLKHEIFDITNEYLVNHN